MFSIKKNVKSIVARHSSALTEKSLMNSIKLATQEKNYPKLINNFSDLGDIYFNYSADNQKQLIDKQYSLLRAAALYNFAINICDVKQIQINLKSALSQKIQVIEQRFLNLLQMQHSVVQPLNSNHHTHKKTLAKIRKDIKKIFIKSSIVVIIKLSIEKYRYYIIVYHLK